MVGGTSKPNAINKIIPTRIENQKASNLASNSDFSIVNNHSELPLDWNDSFNICGRAYTCKINVTDGWDDRQSFQLSTANNTINTWSFVKGREIDVKAGQKYQLVSHMKLNDWATQSHVVLEGFNETSKRCYQIIQCSNGLNGYWEFLEFRLYNIQDRTLLKIRHEYSLVHACDILREIKTFALLIPAHELP